MAVAAGGLRAESVPWLVRSGITRIHLGASVRPGGSWDKSHVDARLRPLVAAAPRQRRRPWPGAEPASRLTARWRYLSIHPRGPRTVDCGHIWSATCRTTSCTRSRPPTAYPGGASSATTTTCRRRRMADLVAAGALPVSSRELLERLTAGRAEAPQGDRDGAARPGQRAAAPAEAARPATWLRSPPWPDRSRPSGSSRGSRGCAAGGCGCGSSRTPWTPIRSATSRARDADRAADFTEAWMDDEVAAVVAGRGGYGTQRMLDLLDWRRLAEARPKILAGFSDITALHQAVAQRLGLVSLHSHVTTSLGSASDDSAERMRAMLFEPAAVDLFAGAEVRSVAPGSADGCADRREPLHAGCRGGYGAQPARRRGDRAAGGGDRGAVPHRPVAHPAAAHGLVRRRAGHRPRGLHRLWRPGRGRRRAARPARAAWRPAGRWLRLRPHVDLPHCPPRRSSHPRRTSRDRWPLSSSSSPPSPDPSLGWSGE